MTIVVNPHNEQEEKVLLAFLESLQYDYLIEEDDDLFLTEVQKKELLRRDADFKNGKITARPWEEVLKDLQNRYS